MKTFVLFAALAAAAAFSPAFADVYDDFASYDAGMDNAWFFELSALAQKKGSAAQVRENLARAISSKPVSDAAFRGACLILKPIADSDTIPALAPALKNPARVSSACNVLIGLGSDGFDALKSALGSVSDNYCRETIISSIASFGGSDAAEAIAPFALSDDAKLAEFATVALGTIGDSAVLETLEKNVKSSNPAVKKAAENALVSFARLRFAAGDRGGARRALASVGEDCGSAVRLRALIAKKGGNRYLDKLIMGGGKLSAPAGRAMNGRREFSESAKIISAFPKLPREGKLAAMGTFMLSGDTRFYPVIAPELDSADPDIRAEAIYAARFICTDDANLRKIWDIYKQWQKPFSPLARNVLNENPSPAMAAILKEKAKSDLIALEILVIRGDVDARKKLWEMFAAPNRSPQVASTVEKTITYGDLPEFARFLKSSDKSLATDASKIIIKKLAKSRDKAFMRSALPQIMKGNADEGGEQYKFISSKLGL